MFAKRSNVVQSSILFSLICSPVLAIPVTPKLQNGKLGREHAKRLVWLPPTEASDAFVVANLAGGYGSSPVAARLRLVSEADSLAMPVDSEIDLARKFDRSGMIWSNSEGRYVPLPDVEGSAKPVNGIRTAKPVWDGDGFNTIAPDYGVLPDLSKPIGDPVVGGKDGERFPDVYGADGTVRKDAHRADDDDSKIELSFRHRSMFNRGIYNQIVHQESRRAAAWCRGRIRGQSKRGSVWDFYGTIRNQLETRMWMMSDRYGRLFGAFPIADAEFARIVGRILYGRRTNQTYRVDDDGVVKIGNIGRLRYPRRMWGGLAADLVAEEQLETAGGIVVRVNDDDMRRHPWGVDPVRDAEKWAKYMAKPERFGVKPEDRITFNVRGAYTTSTGFADVGLAIASANESRSIRDGDVRDEAIGGLTRMIDDEARTIRRIMAENIAGSLTDADRLALQVAEQKMCRLASIAGTYHADRIVKKAKRALWTARIMDRDLMIQRQTSESWKPGAVGIERVV